MSDQGSNKNGVIAAAIAGFATVLAATITQCGSSRDVNPLAQSAIAPSGVQAPPSAQPASAAPVQQLMQSADPSPPVAAADPQSSQAAAMPSPGGRCTDDKDRNVRVINDTSIVLERLYGSNVGTSDWQEDVLGQQVLQPGGTVSVNFDDGTCYCNFDLKAMFQDGDEVIKERFNVCTMGEWRIHE